MHSLGGMEMLVWDLARGLARLGARVGVVTTSIPGYPPEFAEAGVDVAALDGTPPGRYSPHWWRASASYLAKQSPADIAAVLSVSAAGFALLRLKSRFPGTRFVMQAHGTSWDEIRSKWRGGGLRGKITSLRNLAWLPKDIRAYRQFDQVVAVGDTVMASFGRPPLRAVLPPCRRRLIQNGIDTEIFSPDAQVRVLLRARHPAPAAARVIVSVSRLHPQKGGAAALRAFAEYAAQAASGGTETAYWIIGEGPERQRLAAQAQELGVAPLVRFLGHQDRRELAGYLRAADVFLFLGSRIEVGLPLNVLEALACGLPVVLAAHLISESWPGLFPVQADDAGLVAALRAAASNGGERRSLLPAAFELRHCLRAYLDLLAPAGS